VAKFSKYFRVLFPGNEVNLRNKDDGFILLFIRPSRDGPYCVIVYGGRTDGRAGRRPHRFPHNNFSSVYQIFTKLGHMIFLWKGKNPIYFGVIITQYGPSRDGRIKSSIKLSSLFLKFISLTGNNTLRLTTPN
jgi:hypothetical protein